MDLDDMIQNLEAERQRIEEALEVLRRLYETRRAPAANSGRAKKADRPTAAAKDTRRPKGKNRE